MNLLLYTTMAVAGFMGCLHEMWFQRTNKSLLAITILLFVLTACSRIGYSPDGDDLFVYISYFQRPEESYFEPGYLFLTSLMRFLGGDSAYTLVAGVTMWIVFFSIIAAWLAEKFVSETSLDMIDYYYPCTFLFVMMMYWGCFFACETLRTGMSIALLFCATSLIINGKMLLAIIPALLAPLFHLSAIIFIVGMLVVIIAKQLSRNQFLLWFGALILIDIIMGVFKGFSLINNEFFQLLSEFDALVHYTDYGSDQESGSVLTTQYITYHLFGLLMLLGKLDDPRYNKSVMIYFMGLTVGTLFQSLEVAIRIQWIFLAMVVFPLYYFLKDMTYSLKLRSSMALGFGVIQGIMILRVLSWHI